VSGVGKLATGVKRGKTFSQCQARENTQPVLGAGKYATPVPSTGKCAEAIQYWTYA